MKLFYGPFAALEDAFTQQVRSVRSSALSKWLVVCSSSLVAQELKKCLAHRLGALANIHFITGTGLLGRLDAEAEGDVLPLFPQDHLRDFLIKDILSEPALNRYPISDGFAQAVKSSLRDLSDALVDPEVFLEHVCTLPDSVSPEEKDRLLWVVNLYRRYCEREKEVKGFRPYQSAFERAMEQVEKSSYLKDFEQIVWYGYYDMSARQLDFFNRIRQLYPVTVFAPYQPLAAYSFAEKFFQTNWLTVPDNTYVDKPLGALGKSAEGLFASDISAPCERLKMVSASNLQGELFFTAKEILRLVEKEGYSFGDIAVVARTTTPYQKEIRRCFAENKIPLDATFSYPLTHYSLGRFCQTLLSLVEKGVERERVLSLLSSPYFKHPKKYAWCASVRRSLVKRDLSQWQALLPYIKEYDAELLHWLEEVCKQLEVLSAPQKWSEGVEKVLSLLRQQTDESSFEGKDAEIYQSVCGAIEKIKAYEQIRPFSRQGEFLQEVNAALENLQFSETEAVRGGVLFTDAVRMRGVQTKVVFVLGLNDKSFPLVAAEDPILRDNYRSVLRDVLGYWMNRSLDRLSEEKLLFFLTVTAAQKKLYALYWRQNEEGKEVAPSLYAAELARAAQYDWQSKALCQSGRLREMMATLPTEFLTPKELSYAFVFSPQTARENYEKAGLLTPDKENALYASSQWAVRGGLNEFDGQIGPRYDFFKRENDKGFSPSSLQILSKCPLQYFFEKGLRLENREDPLSREGLPYNRKGSLLHDVLHDFYEELYKNGQLKNLFDSGLVAHLNKIIDRHFFPAGYRAFGLYPLVWEMITEEVRAVLADFVTQDVKHLGSFVPSRFEQETVVPPAELPIRLRGFIDRIDVDVENRRFFVVDYKLSPPKKASAPQKITKELEKHILRDSIFQPFLYVYMLEQLPAWKNYTSAGSALLTIFDKYDRYELTPQAFEALRARAVRFFTDLTNLIKNGNFFIVYEKTQCAYCPYGTICRKDSFRSLLRAEQSEIYKSLAQERY